MVHLLLNNKCPSGESLRESFLKTFQSLYVAYPFLFLSLLGMLTVLLLFLFKKTLFFFLIFIGINMLVGFIVRGPLRMLLFGVELSMFSAVLFGVLYGSKAGLLMGLFGSLVMLIFQRRTPLFVIAFIPLYALFGFLAGYFQHVDITLLGILFSLVYGMVSSAIVFFLMGGKLVKCIWFIVTNLVFNVAVFLYVAPVLVRLMAV